MIQLILHLLGDFITQSDWMAQNKTKRSWPAFCHALVYSLPFLMIGSGRAVWVIFFTHFFIDRFRLARFVVYSKNILLAPSLSTAEPQWHDFVCDADHSKALEEHHKYWSVWSWENCNTTGYPKESPAWLSVWLLIAADNTMHLAINYAALLWL